MDQTLLDRDTTVLHFARDQHKRLNFPLAVDDFVEQFRVLDNNGYTPKSVVYAQLFPNWDIDVLTEDFMQHYPQFACLYDGAEEVLAALKLHYHLGLITNGSVQTQQSKVAILCLEQYFDAILISEAEGIKKPEPALFIRALEQLNTRAEDAVMVGDHYANDIVGAQAVGMAGILRRTAHNMHDTHPYTFQHYSQFLGVLGSLPQ